MAHLPTQKKRRWFSATECPWSCQECNRTYVNLKAMRKHQRYKHGKLSEPKYAMDRAALEGSGNFECELCIATFTQGDDFQKHLLEAHGMAVLDDEEGEESSTQRILVLKGLDRKVNQTKKKHMQTTRI